MQAMATGGDVVNSCGVRQLCSGLKAGDGLVR